MRCTSALIADHAKVADSLIYVNGGWPEWWNLRALPDTQTLYFVLVFELEVEELGQELPVTMEFTTGVGARVELLTFNVHLSPDVDRFGGAPLRYKHVQAITITFGDVGGVKFHVMHQGEEIATVPLGVRLPTFRP